MKQNETISFLKSSGNYECLICKYFTSRKSQYDRHLSTDKHKKRTNETNETKMKQISSKKFHCDCGVFFNSKTTLWRHKKVCNGTKISSDMITTELVLQLIKDHKELKQIIFQQNDTINNLVQNGVSNNNSHNVNSMNNNKTFNLQFFLNETCKDAMNISEFVKTIKMDLDDLEHTGRTNYIEGVSNIVIKNLNNLEQQLRPLHCSDYKREVLYIKDNDKWTKEDKDKPILTKAIKVIANENIKNINEWVKKYPDCCKYDSKKNDLYLKIVSNSMNGLTKEESDKNINKIISNIAKEVIIAKN